MSRTTLWKLLLVTFTLAALLVAWQAPASADDTARWELSLAQGVTATNITGGALSYQLTKPGAPFGLWADVDLMRDGALSEPKARWGFALGLSTDAAIVPLLSALLGDVFSVLPAMPKARTFAAWSAQSHEIVFGVRGALLDW